MLRCSTRAVFINRNEIARFGSVNISRQPFCSQVVDNSDGDGEIKSKQDAILNSSPKGTNKIKVAQATRVLGQMADLKRSKQISEQDYISDSRFNNMIKLLESNIDNNTEPLFLVKGLKDLAELGVPNESFCVKNLENSLMWSTRSCPLKDLMMLLSFSMSRRQTESQNKLFSEVCRTLERRWVEIKGDSPLIVTAPSDNFWVLLNKNQFNHLVESGKDSPKPMLLRDIKDGKTFNSLFYYSEQFSPQFIARLEDRMADVVDELPAADLVLILSQLGRKKRRNVPLLKAISFYICKHKTMLDIKQISDCLYSFNKLSFKDQTTVETLCSELVSRVPDLQASPVLRSLLTSLGQLKFRHPPLMEAIMTWYQAKLDAGTPLATKDLTSLVMTLATTNYRPEKQRKLLQHLLQEISQLKTSLSELVWLDTVWSLTIIGLVNNDLLESVLNSNFQHVLQQNNSTNIGASLKLLNINGAARLLHQDYKGPTLNAQDDALMRDIKIHPSAAKQTFNKSVLDAVNNLCPEPKYSSLNVNTLLGFVAEADLVLNANAQPLIVGDFSNMFGQKEPAKPLPEGAKRVAVICASFQDCLLGGELSGVTAFNIKLLEASGYQVLLVKHTNWPASQNQVSRVSAIDQHMKNIVGVKE